jgi:hypothetical protein
MFGSAFLAEKTIEIYFCVTREKTKKILSFSFVNPIGL